MLEPKWILYLIRRSVDIVAVIVVFAVVLLLLLILLTVFQMMAPVELLKCLGGCSLLLLPLLLRLPLIEWIKMRLLAQVE